ncbi:glycosyltransferase [Pseudovibrio flavus]|uniref:glycosyltransferase n=1 Tax=Pseudovibrio flavus TaxID=2529854 RepID=UPI00211C7E82|nr:glycosyltransferase [Pseudovibrio flavus]
MTKHDLVVFGEDWGRHPSSTQHLIKSMVNGRQVIWVNSIGMRRPKLSGRDLKRVWEKARSILGAPLKPTLSNMVAETGATAEPLPKGLHILSPIAIPWPGNKLAAIINRFLLSRQIRKKMRSLGISHPLVWTSLPPAVVIAGALDEKALIYYCGDDFGALAGVDHKPVLDMEKDLVRQCDLVIAASEELASRFPQEKTLLIPHGVDFGLFTAPHSRPLDMPASPVAGFYGSIADWVDTARLAKAAKALPDWNFVFIGKVETDISTLQFLPNVHFLGPRDHAALPAYVQHFDVALLPFKDNDQIKACNPLKLREYMAAGQPIVSTVFPSMEPYRKLLRAVTPEENLANAILEARADTDRNDLRREFVRQESWDERARRIESVLDTF